MYTGFLSDAISREVSTPIALACVLCEPGPVDRLIVPEQAQQHSEHDLGSWAENLRASEKNVVATRSSWSWRESDSQKACGELGCQMYMQQVEVVTRSST